MLVENSNRIKILQYWKIIETRSCLLQKRTRKKKDFPKNSTKFNFQFLSPITKAFKTRIHTPVRNNHNDDRTTIPRITTQLKLTTCTTLTPYRRVNIIIPLETARDAGKRSGQFSKYFKFLWQLAERARTIVQESFWISRILPPPFPSHVYTVYRSNPPCTCYLARKGGYDPPLFIPFDAGASVTRKLINGSPTELNFMRLNATD